LATVADIDGVMMFCAGKKACLYFWGLQSKKIKDNKFLMISFFTLRVYLIIIFLISFQHFY
jgi:hypothetical protein